MAERVYDLGPVSEYAIAVAEGYQGSRQQWLADKQTEVICAVSADIERLEEDIKETKQEVDDKLAELPDDLNAKLNNVLRVKNWDAGAGILELTTEEV